MPGKKVGHYFDNHDCFKQNVSSFNIEGQEHIGTTLGFILSVLVVVFVVVYAGIKGNIMLRK
jgi:hypothetical protein